MPPVKQIYWSDKQTLPTCDESIQIPDSLQNNWNRLRNDDSDSLAEK